LFFAVRRDRRKVQYRTAMLDGRGLVDDLEPFPRKYIPATGRIFQLPLSSRSPLDAVHAP